MTTAMKTEPICLTRDGLTLRGFQSLPDENTFDVAVLFHGFMMNCGREPDSLIFQLSEALNRCGIATVRVDFAGQGKSDGRSEDMSVLSELLDASCILRYAKQLPGTRHLFVHGQSQGGVVASMIAGIYPDLVDKLVLTAPAATLKEDAIHGRLMDITYNPNAVPDVQTVLENRIGGFYLRTNQKLPIYEWASFYNGPVLILHADGDATVDKYASVKYHEIYTNSKLHILPGGNHPLSGEVRQTVLSMVCDFLTGA